MRFSSLFKIKVWKNWFYQSRFSRVLSDEQFIKQRFKMKFGKKLDLENPRTFNEKLQWLKLYNRNPEYTTMVDKHEAKKYVAERIGEEYIIPTLGVWDKFDDIDFDILPEKFVLKTTHDCGGLIICKDKTTFDKKETKKFLSKHLKTDYYMIHREWPYKNVKPRIIAEQYMVDESGYELKDYKFFCFNGLPKIILVCMGRFQDGGLKENFYSPEWELLDLKRPMHKNAECEILPPKNLSKMLFFARKLSKGIPFLRVDFYEINGEIYFGELTFFPASGFKAFEPEEWDIKLGGWLELPEKYGEVI